MISRHAMALNVLEYSKTVKEYHSGITREFAGHEFHRNVWNIMKKEIGSQMPCKIQKMWKRVCEDWYSVALNVLEELYN